MDHEQRINMKFCFKLQKSAKETHEMLKLIYGDAAVTMKMVYKWFERFRNGCESVEDEERLGRPSTSKIQENVERVSEMIRSNRWLTIREISEDLNVSYVHRKQPENGKTVSSSIMTTLRVIHRLWYGNFCQKYYGVSSSTLFTGSGTSRLLALPQSQNDHER